MSDEFDPYYQWLGIPPKHQPADHYRLLGIEQFEANTDVIGDAAERQITHVRRKALSQQSQLSQKILNELAGAKVCLLDPVKKAAYDEALQARLSAAALMTAPVPIAPIATVNIHEPVSAYFERTPSAGLLSNHVGPPLAKPNILRRADQFLLQMAGSDNTLLHGLLRVAVPLLLLLAIFMPVALIVRLAGNAFTRSQASVETTQNNPPAQLEQNTQTRIERESKTSPPEAPPAPTTLKLPKKEHNIVVLPPKPTSDTIQRQWLNESYNSTLRNIKDKEWAEFDNKTGKITLRYEETASTDDCLELFCSERKQEIRFLSTRAELKKGDKWEWVAKGHWVSITPINRPAPFVLPATPRVK